LICFTNSGMSAERTTSTNPTIASTQVMPAAAGKPIAVNSQCQDTSTSSTSHLSGQRMIPIRSGTDQSFLRETGTT
jgi:hypothetical protein